MLPRMIIIHVYGVAELANCTRKPRASAWISHLLKRQGPSFFFSLSRKRIWDETRKPGTQWRCDNARSFTRYIHSQVRGLNSRLRESRHRERDSSSLSPSPVLHQLFQTYFPASRGSIEVRSRARFWIMLVFSLREIPARNRWLPSLIIERGPFFFRRSW